MDILINFIFFISNLVSPTWGTQFTHHIAISDLDNSGDVYSVGGTTNHVYQNDLEITGVWSVFSYNFKGIDPYKTTGNMGRFTRMDFPLSNGDTQAIFFERGFNQAGEDLVLKLEWIGDNTQTVEFDWNVTQGASAKAYISLVSPQAVNLSLREDTELKVGNIHHFRPR
jgi:hypothetical protein